MGRGTQLVTALFDYASSKEARKGFTVPQVAKVLKATEPQIHQAIHRLRRDIADDKIALVCVPGDWLESWVYSLVDTFKDAKRWIRIRLKDSHSRLVTAHDAAKAVLGSTDASTVEGRKARIIERGTRRILEDLEEVDAKSDGAPTFSFK